METGAHINLQLFSNREATRGRENLRFQNLFVTRRIQEDEPETRGHIYPLQIPGGMTSAYSVESIIISLKCLYWWP